MLLIDLAAGVAELAGLLGHAELCGFGFAHASIVGASPRTVDKVAAVTLYGYWLGGTLML